MDSRQARGRVWAMGLSRSRLLWLVMMVAAIWAENQQWVTPGAAMGIKLAALFLAAVSDGLDGHVARITNSTSKEGGRADAFWDKIFIDGTMIAMALSGQLNWWLVGAMVTRDVLIDVYRHEMQKLDLKTLGDYNNYKDRIKQGNITHAGIERGCE